MKSVLILLPALLGAFALAQLESADLCACPQVKCPGDDPAKLCECLNAREKKCKEICPKHKPTYKICPTKPSPPTPTPSCECEQMFCIQVWPQSCYCGNDNAKRCYEQCGGPEPAYQSCPPLSEEPIATPKPTKTKSMTTTTKPKTTKNPRPTNPICGGGRGNYYQCEDGYTCIKDPRDPGCGPACDALGICVEDKLCGGFAGFSCSGGKVCMDDPRDDCDPKQGGADCGGVCMWLD